MEIADTTKALKLYYSKSELRTPDIVELFSCSRCKAQLLKRSALEKQIAEGARTFSAQAVDTECAYKAWGIDIEKLKERYMELKKLKI